MSVEILSQPVPGQDPPCSYTISAPQVVDLLRTSLQTPLPEADRVFPWLHGIAAAKCPQTSYFEQKSPSTERHIPQLLMPVRVGRPSGTFSAPSGPHLLNSVHPDEILQRCDGELVAKFLDSDPCAGVNLRNLELQTAKCVRYATLLVYSFDRPEEVSHVAQLLLRARESSGAGGAPMGGPILVYTGTCSEIAELDPGLISRVDSAPYDPLNHAEPLHWDLNFGQFSRLEILHMAKASKISFDGPDAGGALWLGNAMDATLGKWKTLVECVAEPRLPSISRCDHHVRLCGREHPGEAASVVFEFPASDVLHPATMSANDVVLMLNLCKAVWARSSSCLTLAVSPEGYRGNSVFAILYCMYVTGKSMSDAIVLLYRDNSRPLLCSDGDVEILRTLEALFREFTPGSPLARSIDGAISSRQVGATFGRLTAKMYEAPHGPLANFRGSLPSRIMDHLYLGGLVHAESPEFLKELGITRVLSVGECLPWVTYTEETSYTVQGVEVRYLSSLLDDGMDSLLPRLDEALDFLKAGREQGLKTLVHCRVGVSRSAAICIAEVMTLTGWSLPRAFLYVRVRRLNLIIQPNLRFLYELVKIEERLSVRRGNRLRQMEWPVLCREIARINL